MRSFGSGLPYADTLGRFDMRGIGYPPTVPAEPEPGRPSKGVPVVSALPLAIAGTGYGLIGLLVIILLIVLIVRVL